MKVVDLFSGCGGMSLGFQNAGFEVVMAIDNWSPAVEVYRNNFNHQIFELDIKEPSAISLIKSFNPDMIIGGPPCQDFSSAGNMDETKGRADLTISYANVVSEISPEWFVMENVERITKSNILKTACDIFKDAGYGITAKVIDASFCGVPQARKRFFLIGKKGVDDGFLEPFLESGLSAKPMTMFDYFGTSLGIEYYYRHPRSYKRRGVFSIHEPSPTIRGVNRPIPKGYSKHVGDPVDISNGVRPLTVLERAKVQTFPDWFRFTGTVTDINQMVGNAVPVKLAEYLASRINQYITN